MSEAEHDRRERLKREVAEDLRKQVEHLLTDIHEESIRGLGDVGAPVTRTMARFASLLGVLSIQADIQTRRIVRLTWALVFLTTALLVFTVYLFRDTHILVKHEQMQQPSAEHPAR